MAIRRFATNITQDTDFSTFNGNAIHGELVVNLDDNPPRLYISDNDGNLTAVATVTTVNAGMVQVPKSTGGPVTQQGSQVTVNNNGTLASSWLLSLDEANSMIISQGNTFVIGHGDVNFNGVDTFQLPDGGLLSSYWNILQPSLGTQISNITIQPNVGATASDTLTADHSYPVIIDGVIYYIMLSSNP